MEKPTTPDTLLAWLQHNKGRLSLSLLESEAGLPEKTLRHYVSGNRGLKEESRMKVLAVLADMQKNWPVV